MISNNFGFIKLLDLCNQTRLLQYCRLDFFLIQLLKMPAGPEPIITLFESNLDIEECSQKSS